MKGTHNSEESGLCFHGMAEEMTQLPANRNKIKFTEVLK